MGIIEWYWRKVKTIKYLACPTIDRIMGGGSAQHERLGKNMDKALIEGFNQL